MSTALTGLNAHQPVRPGAIGTVVERFLDSVTNWLTGLPSTPIADFLSGAVWLVRKTLFPVGSGVGLGGTAACVTTGDCSNQDLSGADLSGQVLSGVNFTNANLSVALLGKANLTTANLTNANLDRASLHSANLTEANLTGATMFRAYLDRANFTGANLTGAILAGVESAHLARSTWTNANLTGQDLSGRTLRGINFTGANLTNVKLAGSDLTAARLTNANLTNANLQGAVVAGVPDTDLISATWTGANVTGLDLSRRNLTGIDFTGVNLTDVHLTRVNFSYANLTNAILPSPARMVGISWLQTTCPKGNKSDTGCSSSVPLDTAGVSADYAAGLWANEAPYPGDGGNRSLWQDRLTQYSGDLAKYDGEVVRIANNSAAPVTLKVDDPRESKEYVTLPVGSVVWVGLNTKYANAVEVRSEQGGWGQLIFTDPEGGADGWYPTAKVAYFDQNPSDSYSVGDERYYYCKAGDAPVALAVTIKRLQDPKNWMSDADKLALAPRGETFAFSDWAVFTVSIDQMGRTDV